MRAPLDHRTHPDRYRVARGEQGVLTVEPYKSEILPHWAFRTPAIALRSSREILALFARYKKARDFVGMDMARKFLQMGYTRSRRYANHRSGQKYVGPVPRDKKGQSGAHGRPQAPREPDPLKAKSAEIFKRAWQKVERDQVYLEMRRQWRERLG